jgi:CRISPR-associated endonuclease/helicase Cas3
MRWDGENSQLVTAEEIRPGDILVVDSSRGGITAGSFDPESEVPVTDLGDLAQLRSRGTASLRVSGQELAVWQLPEDAIARLPHPTNGEEDPAETRECIAQWLAELPAATIAGGPFRTGEWERLLQALRSRRLRIDVIQGKFLLRAPRLREEPESEPEVADALTEDDDSSFRQAQVTLQAHSGGVRELAEQYAKSLGFDATLVQDLALAGWLHDIGKADPRFQRWLVGGSEVRLALLDEPLAKSELAAEDPIRRQIARQIAGYPAGYRHELLSLAMAAQAEDALATAHDRELVLHLIASHHGWCRPLPPPIDDPEDIPVSIDHGGVAFHATTRHRLARLDSGISERFWALNARYGCWGLAWLEAVLRLADHRRSEAESEARS